MSELLHIPTDLSAKTWMIDKYLSSLEGPLILAAKKLILVSDYACKHIPLLVALLSQPALPKPLSRAEYFLAVKQLPLTLSQQNFMEALRVFRHQHFLRILILQYANILSTADVMRVWSDCADAIILHVLDHAEHELSQRYGNPCNAEGDLTSLFALAMGKLGGRELNYSSDIDLIFVFSESGQTNGTEVLANQQYYSKVVQHFVTLLHTINSSGFVFRVDLRLRPNGDSGPLVLSMAAIEAYYQEQGRDWERYAMVKARVVSESLDTMHPWYDRLIIPFVYRRYVDFSVIESLRSMKAMIEREVQLNPHLDDIKRGKGGIREVEFIIQNVQLIRGGRHPQLRQRNAVLALDILNQEQILPDAEGLKQAYLFLRRLENTIQSLNDQQTHALPTDITQQAQVTYAMGLTTWDVLLMQLYKHQSLISDIFHTVLGQADFDGDEKRLLTNQLNSLWQGHVEEAMAINVLKSLGFKEAQHCYQMLHSFRYSPRCRRLSQSARLRLDRFMVALLVSLSHSKNTDEILLQIMKLLEHIVGRSAYLALLTENPQALTELLYWFEHSPFIISLLVKQPFLLEVLLEKDISWRPKTRSTLNMLLQEQLSHAKDFEDQEECLRQFKLTNWLMAARAELYGESDVVRIGQYLSDLAEVIVNQVLSIAVAQLTNRYPEMYEVQSRFAIIAYGKLGSREMNYVSDIDLVFLHTVKPSQELLVTRLTQKILTMLTTRSQSGILYSVDTRLRPSGSSGLLVSQMDAFIEYQKNEAWTWEHQALLKARMISGSLTIKKQLMNMKQDIFQKYKNPHMLEQEVRAMRAKMDAHQDPQPMKHARGGLLDLEFLVQFLVLNAQDPAFARLTHTSSHIKRLALIGALSGEQASRLSKAYRCYHHIMRQNTMHPIDSGILELQKAVSAICDAIYKY
jgi:[glutamine synthetase] adenylyltransferase / [glutamine synthetase]-adenylyl-L-tyrosine phosphorylase